jgi:Skp family chaperone for outer membrane proteins
MFKFRLVVGGVLLGLLSFSAFAQGAQAGKIVLINTAAFYDEKTGITKLITAEKLLDTEFAVKIKALQDGNVRLQGISAELQNMQKLPAAQFNQVVYTTKQDEGAQLQRKLGYDKTDLEAAIGKRRKAVISPISQDIGKAIDEFGKKNGYAAVFDVSKMGESGALLFLAESSDVTKEFVAFYNARPATAAPPK